ncbi:hypothetical protein ACPVTF_15740 [Geobacillus icigianus]
MAHCAVGRWHSSFDWVGVCMEQFYQPAKTEGSLAFFGGLFVIAFIISLLVRIDIRRLRAQHEQIVYVSAAKES